MQIKLVLLLTLCLAPLLKIRGQEVIARPYQKKVLVKEIQIFGNKRTKPSVLLRELPFKIDDSLAGNEIKSLEVLAKNQLTALALFHDIFIEDSISGNEIYFAITVRERWYIFPEPTFSLADRNFNEWWKTKQIYRTTYGINIYDLNVRGRNERLVINLIDGWHRSLGLQYKIPYLNKSKTLGAQLSAQYQVGHEVPYITLNDRLQYIRVNEVNIFKKTNAELQFNYRRKLKTTHTLNIGFEFYDIADTITLKENPSFLSSGKTSLMAPYINYRYTYQSLDYFFYPQKGFYFSAAIEKRGYKGGEINIWNSYWDVEQYTPLYSNLYLANSLKIQASPNKTLPYIYSNSLGYRDLVRGYEHYVINGNAYGVLNNELKTKISSWKIKLPHIIPSQFNPAPLQIYLKVYYDIGYVNSNLVNSINVLPNKTLQGYGLGFDFISYYDSILRIEYSINNLGQKELFLHYLAAF